MPPLRIAVQLTHWLMVGDNGEQLTLSIRGGDSVTSTVALELRSLPLELRTVKVTVFVPEVLKLVW